MTLDMVDLVWSAMREGELYSSSDLANRLGQPDHAVVRILDFLARYRFAERITQREPIFRRLADALAPGDAMRILRALVEDASPGHTERVTASRTHKGRDETARFQIRRRLEA